MNYLEAIKILDDSGFFWSFGKHPEFKYECRVYHKTGLKVEHIRIFIGNNLDDCLAKAIAHIDDFKITRINS